MIKCRIIQAVEDAQHTRDVRFAVYTLTTFLAIFVTLLAEWV